MKNIFFAFAFMLVSSFAFANDISTHLIEKNISSLNEISKIQVTGEINLNNSPVSVVSAKCWAFRIWLKHQLKEISDDEELIDETADALKELCEIASDFGWI
ncbi:MAG: hypothetical protein GQ540_00350 [Lutibacter sp.]|uniref:hypothetical protein n=1 Tax=Lutibacter sp. TaxID=1925666 RepID=UPI0019F70157|nr:hypothetical protein [Lutibacter sp.]NOR26960.1 hypothetical protein [Lutibacter sp.]